MKPVLILLFAGLLSASVLAQPFERGPMRGPGPGREARQEDDLRQRHERMQEFRQEMRRQRQEGREEQRGMRNADPEERPRGLRRLNAEERQRLRQEMREAYRR